MTSHTSNKITVFDQVGISKSGIYIKLKTQQTRLLLCMIVHAAASGNQALHKSHLEKCLIETSLKLTSNNVNDTLNTAICDLRRFLKEGGWESACIFDRALQTYTLNISPEDIDACEFEVAYKKTLDPCDIQEMTDLLLDAVEKCNGRLDSIGIKNKSFTVELNRLRAWQCDVRYRLAQCYEQQGNLQKAWTYAKMAVDADYESEMCKELEARIHSALQSSLATVQEEVAAEAIDTRNICRLPPLLAPSFRDEDEVGRLADEITQRAPTSASRRICTITGHGGSGKTRLAIEVAYRLQQAFTGAVFFVPLADITEAEAIPLGMVEALGLKPASDGSVLDQLTYALSSHPCLIVLDNFEHLLGDRASGGGWKIMQQLTAACPALRLLITSRESLGISGERVWPISRLELPDEGDPVEKLRKNSCVQLYADRARAKSATFVLNSSNVRAIASLCRSLDGLPLAIELAAARICTISPEEMRLHFASAPYLKILTSSNRDVPNRHKSLSAAFEWSYQLLKPEHQALFARLSTFSGGWDLEAATAVCTEDGQDLVRERLETLVDCSLVNAISVDTKIRYSMLATLQEFSAEKLGSDTACSNRHRNYYFSLVRQLHPYLNDRRSSWAKLRMQQEHANICASIDSALTEGADEEALEISGKMSRYWRMRGNLADANRILQRVIAQIATGVESPSLTMALNGAGSIAYLLGEYHIAEDCYQKACSNAVKIADPLNLSIALRGVGHVEIANCRFAEAKKALTESLHIARDLSHAEGIALSLFHLSAVFSMQGKVHEAHKLVDECISILKETGSGSYPSALYQKALLHFVEGKIDMAASYAEEANAIDRSNGTEGMASALLGRIAVARGVYNSAEATFTTQLEHMRSVGNKACIATILQYRGRLFLQQGDYVRARASYEESLRNLRQTLNTYRVASLFAEMARLALLENSYHRAAFLYAAMQELHRNIGACATPIIQSEFRVDQERLNSILGANEVARMREIMHATSMEDMVRYALDPTLTLPSIAYSMHRNSVGIGEKLAASEKLANVPNESNAFIGRDDEIEQIQRLLEESRLVTLCGLGGIGKTRIAFQISSRVQHRFPDGVNLIELASETDPARFFQTVYNAIGINVTDECTSQAVIDFIGERQMLLLLDNCEHMAEECANLAHGLLRRCGGLRILATSRESLKIDEEQVFQVPPMSVPEANENFSATLLERYEATKLFCVRAKAAHDKFLPTDSAAPDIAAICHRLDGIPLAIELAAAWISLGTQEIRHELCDSFEILNMGSQRKTERHRTIRAAIEWSCSLLDPGDVQLLRWLSIFAGGWTVEAARSICSDALLSGTNMLRSHNRLMGMSLILKQEIPDGSRFRMQEMIREYSAELLNTEDRLMLNGVHATYFTGFAARHSALLYGRDQAFAMTSIGDDYYNILLALDWFASEGGDPRQGLALSASMARYWWLKGSLLEGRRYLEMFLDSPSNQSPSGGRAMALNGLGSLAFLQGDHATNAKAYTEALKIAEEIGHLSIMAVAHRGLGSLHMSNGELEKAGQHFEASENCSCAVDDELNYFLAIEKRGQLAIWTRDYESAKFHLEKCVINSRRNDNLQGLSSSLYHLSQVHFGAREYDDVERLCTEADEIDRELGFPGARASSMLGVTAMRRGNIDIARIILEETLERKRSTNKPEAILPALRNLARACIVKADYAAGKLLLVEALRLAYDQKISRQIALTLDEMGCHAAAVGQIPRAAVLWGASEVAGMPPFPGPPNYDAEYRAEYEAMVRADLPPAELILHTQRGRSFTETDAILYALSGTL